VQKSGIGSTERIERGRSEIRGGETESKGRRNVKTWNSERRFLSIILIVSGKIYDF